MDLKLLNIQESNYTTFFWKDYNIVQKIYRKSILQEKFLIDAKYGEGLYRVEELQQLVKAVKDIRSSGQNIQELLAAFIDLLKINITIINIEKKYSMIKILLDTAVKYNKM